MSKETAQERILRKSIPEPNSGCWIWLFPLNKWGYPEVGYLGESWRANRLAWEAFRGPIPEGKIICHRCDNRACVNPDHLFVGTNLENTRDCINKNRIARGSKHGRAKLTETDIVEIRQSNKAQRPLARKYGVSQRTINNVLARRIWVHV